MSADPAVPAPRATYRLQLNKDFTFADAGRLAPYLGRLGISHAYLSPILKARTGSLHGYDTVDHSVINPEIGTADDFRALAAALRAEGIGIILDIVPNHMGVGGSDNPYWLDVLEHGPASRYAAWFDIDWNPPQPELAGRLLVPVLDRPLAAAIEAGLIVLRRDGDGRMAAWAHGHHKLPLSPESPADLPEGPLGAELARRLLPLQHWRPADFRVGDDELNYRRFFIVSDLAGIRIENDEVFEHVHRLPFALIEQGLVDGLRIDHIDGLYDPAGYMRKLRQRAPRPIYVVVEKILAENESLPASWPIEGTTGYEFASMVTALLSDPRGEPALTAGYSAFTGETRSAATLERDGKLGIMADELSSEHAALTRRLKRLADRERPGGDISLHALGRALREFIAATPVYRTYGDRGGLGETDRAVLAQTLRAARVRAPQVAIQAFDFLETVLCGRADSAEGLDLMARLQQFSGPVMAKGLEDTALYRANRLLALNDVGARPDRFSFDIDRFHAANLARAARVPFCMLAGSTHDSKRGQDARCRLLALTGHAGEWVGALPEWQRLIAAQGGPAIDAEDSYVFFQLLLAAWPGPDLEARLIAAMEKSLREARWRSSWTAPNTSYEGKVADYVRAALRPGENAFLAAFAAFEERIARQGALNGLIATVLQLTVPGVPDIYQGAELWAQALVDPDNRRPVDFSARQAMIGTEAPLAELFDHWRDGAVKQALIRRLLTVRRAHPRLFSRGDYQALDTGRSDRLCAFTRRQGGDRLLVAVARFPWRGPPGDRIGLPEGAWRDLLADADVAGGTIRLDGPLPFAVLGAFSDR